MADWMEKAVRQLLEIAHSDPAFAKLIRTRAKQLDQRKIKGQGLFGTTYVFIDEDNGFKLNYNLHPDTSKVEILGIGLFQ